MAKIETEITIKNIAGYLERTAVPIGNGAHVIVPKEYVGMDFLLVVKGKHYSPVFKKAKAKTQSRVARKI